MGRPPGGRECIRLDLYRKLKVLRPNNHDPLCVLDHLGLKHHGQNDFIGVIVHNKP